MTKHTFWTPDLEQKLIQLYKTHTGNECASILGISECTVWRKIGQLKAFNKQFSYSLNESLFKNITLPEIAYFLGYLFADGCCRRKYEVKLKIAVEDGRGIKNIMFKIGNWKYQEFNGQTKQHKNLSCFRLCNKFLWDFLYQNNFYNKTIVSADKILSQIPEYLHYYFWRGYLDGDGSIYLFKKCNGGKVSFYSHYDKNWDDFANLSKKIEIKYKIVQRIRKTGKSSHVEINTQYDACELLNYIYQNYQNNKIGLERKYNLYIKFIESCKNSLLNSGGIMHFKNIKNKDIYELNIRFQGKTLPRKRFFDFKEIVKFKFEQIKLYNTDEYKLRTSLDFWEQNPPKNVCLIKF